MNKTVVFTLRESYGRKRYFPSCEVSRMILIFMKGRVSFTIEDLKVFEDAGWEVVISFQTDPFE